MATLAPTENELLQALAESMPAAPKDAITARELAAAQNASRHQIDKLLGRLAMQDRLGVHKVPRQDRTGRTKMEPAYTILPAKKKR